MEKPRQQNRTQPQGPSKETENQQLLPKHLLWDCGSSLYDSFELNSFRRQLDSAIITSRTMSMPHISAPPPPSKPTKDKTSSKISRSLQKLLRSLMFKLKRTANSRRHDNYFLVYDKSTVLPSIPESPEINFHRLSPEINSLAGRTTSERFTTSAIGVSCA